MSRLRIRKSFLSLAALVMGLGFSVPAAAGGGHYGYGYHSGYGGYYKTGYRGHRYGRHHHHRRHHRGGGGKGAAIALGVIGGAIILSEAARASERRRYEEGRYYRRYGRYDGYDRRRYDERYYRDDDWYDERDFDRDYMPERDYDDDRDVERRGQDRRDENREYDRREFDGADDLERELEGGAADRERQRRPRTITATARGAYGACAEHARQALANRGFRLSIPARPETAEDMGRAYKITATVVAQNDRGERWRRALYCEANDDRVFRLELI